MVSTPKFTTSGISNIITIHFPLQKSHAADFVTTVTEDKVYCTQFSTDKKFYRVVVKKGLVLKKGTPSKVCEFVCFSPLYVCLSVCMCPPATTVEPH